MQQSTCPACVKLNQIQFIKDKPKGKLNQHPAERQQRSPFLNPTFWLYTITVFQQNIFISSLCNQLDLISSHTCLRTPRLVVVKARDSSDTKTDCSLARLGF